MKPLRIALLCTSGLDNACPQGRLLPIAHELVNHGHQPHLVLLHPTFDQLRPDQKRLHVGDVHVSHVGQMHVYGLPGQRHYYPPAQLAWVTLRGALDLAAATIRLRPQAIHVCKPQPANGLAGLLAAAATGARLFVDCDDYEAEANRFGAGLAGRVQKALVRGFEDKLPRLASAITVNTHFLREHFLRQGVPAPKIVYMPNGVRQDFGALPRQHDGCTVLYLGTLSEVSHGVGLLLQAFAQVLGTHPHTRLLMVGDGDDRDLLHAQAQALSIGSAITWVGRVPAHQTPQFYAQATCSVDPVYDLPVMRARCPLKIAESLAAGVPVVTGDVGDRREMLGPAGVIVKAGDATALADGLRHALYAPQAQAAMSEAALAQAQRFSWGKLVQGWVQMYGQ